MYYTYLLTYLLNYLYLGLLSISIGGNFRLVKLTTEELLTETEESHCCLQDAGKQCQEYGVRRILGDRWVSSAVGRRQNGHDDGRPDRNVLAGTEYDVDETTHERRVETVL